MLAEPREVIGDNYTFHLLAPREMRKIVVRPIGLLRKILLSYILILYVKLKQ